MNIKPSLKRCVEKEKGNLWRDDLSIWISSAQETSTDSVTGKVRLFDSESKVEIHLGKDGHLFLVQLDGSEDMVYLYPEQVQHLKELLRGIK